MGFEFNFEQQEFVVNYLIYVYFSVLNFMNYKVFVSVKYKNFYKK